MKSLISSPKNLIFSIIKISDWIFEKIGMMSSIIFLMIHRISYYKVRVLVFLIRKLSQKSVFFIKIGLLQTDDRVSLSKIRVSVFLIKNWSSKIRLPYQKSESRGLSRFHVLTFNKKTG